MTNDNKQQKVSDSTDTAIAYSTCYVQPFSETFLEDCIQGMKRYPDKYFDLAVCDPPYFSFFLRTIKNKSIFLLKKFA